MKKHGNTGLCKCRHCGAINPWRSDFMYAKNDFIMPGFTGRCRVCGMQDWQTVVDLTDTLEDAVAKATKVG